MQIYMRVCPICANENNRKLGHSRIYVPGWIDTFSDESYADTTCLEHNEKKLIKVAMTCEEFQILRQVSNEPSFMQAMNDLKEKDIVEYNLKMSQFKTQVNQQSQQQENNTPKCPTCSSTNIRLISATSKISNTVMFGLLGTKRHKTYHCNNCKYEW